jgi:hypothetical protein
MEVDLYTKYYNMNTIKLGSSGFDVTVLQEKLDLKVTGYFDMDTHDAVMKFQKAHNLVADGVVGSVTWSTLTMANDTDMSGSKYETMYLSPGKYTKDNTGKMVWYPNYYEGQTNPEWFFLHHTAGGPSPYQTIGIWKDDIKPVATRYVMGGGDKYDGLIVECLKDGQWAAHLTIGGTKVHKESLGLEICNYGGCTKGGYYVGNKWQVMKSMSFYNAYGTEMPADQIYDLGWTYRFHQYFHRYTEKQVEQTRRLLIDVRDTYGIDITQGLPALIRKNGVEKAFVYIPDYVNATPGLYAHGSIFAGKNDIFPQQEMIDMMMSL